MRTTRNHILLRLLGLTAAQARDWARSCAPPPSSIPDGVLSGELSIRTGSTVRHVPLSVVMARGLGTWALLWSMLRGCALDPKLPIPADRIIVLPVRTRWTAMAWPLPFGGWRILWIGCGDGCYSPISEMDNAQTTAVLWHEWGHFWLYHKAGTLGTISMVIRYLASRRYRRDVETCADSFAIWHGHDHGLISARQAQITDYETYAWPRHLRSYLRTYAWPAELRGRAGSLRFARDTGNMPSVAWMQKAFPLLTTPP